MCLKSASSPPGPSSPILQSIPPPAHSCTDARHHSVGASMTSKFESTGNYRPILKPKADLSLQIRATPSRRSLQPKPSSERPDVPSCKEITGERHTPAPSQLERPTPGTRSSVHPVPAPVVKLDKFAKRIYEDLQNGLTTSQISSSRKIKRKKIETAIYKLVYNGFVDSTNGRRHFLMFWFYFIFRYSCDLSEHGVSAELEKKGVAVLMKSNIDLYASSDFQRVGDLLREKINDELTQHQVQSFCWCVCIVISVFSELCVCVCCVPWTAAVSTGSAVPCSQALACSPSYINFIFDIVHSLNPRPQIVNAILLHR